MAKPRKRAGEADLGCSVMGFWAARGCSEAALASDPLLMPGGGKHLLEMPRRVGWQGLPGSGVCRGVCHGVPGGQSGKRGLCQEPRGSLSLQQKTQ